MPIAEQYHRDGYVIVRGVVEAEPVAEALRHARETMARFPDDTPEQIHRRPLWQEDPFYHRFVCQPKLLDLAEAILGPDLALFATGYIIKPPAASLAVLWHQDGSYWPLEPMEVITLWLAVDDSLPENGCMRVIPGTHTLDLKGLQPNTEVANVLSSEIPPEYVDESKAVDCVLRRGGVSVHHPNIIHGSNANTSTLRRCGLTIRYIPATTRILLKGKSAQEGRWPSAFLLRGEAVPGVNDYNPRPRYVPGLHMPFRGCEEWQ